MSDDDRFYFRQFLSGRDFAAGDPIAQQMVNFVYAIGDRVTGEALLVDPAYGIDDLLGLLATDGMSCVGVLATHYHPDHIGGEMAGWTIEGVPELLERVDVPLHVQRDEAPWVERVIGVEASQLALHDDGDIVRVGDIEVELVHTPGHTPGSQCFFVDRRLVSGDTLFLDGCGRTDLPGADPEAMYDSLTRRLAKIPDEAVLYPGHRYSAASSSELGVTRRDNFVFRPRSADEWLAVFGS